MAKAKSKKKEKRESKLAKALEPILRDAAKDKKLKEKFLQNPKQVLGEYNVKLPEGVNLRVVEDTPDTRYVVLPFRDQIIVGVDEAIDVQVTIKRPTSEK